VAVVIAGLLAGESDGDVLTDAERQRDVEKHIDELAGGNGNASGGRAGGGASGNGTGHGRAAEAEVAAGAKSEYFGNASAGRSIDSDGELVGGASSGYEGHHRGGFGIAGERF